MGAPIGNGGVNRVMCMYAVRTYNTHRYNCTYTYTHTILLPSLKLMVMFIFKSLMLTRRALTTREC